MAKWSQPHYNKLQKDGKMVTTTLQQATHFPGILSKQTEASGSILTSQGRWPHTNFTITDLWSGLSITSGVLCHWRAFKRA